MRSMKVGRNRRGRGWLTPLACAVLVLACLLPFTSAGAVRAPDGPSADTLVLRVEDNGRQVELREGQTLAVTLLGNPSTGYQWQVAHVDDGVVREVGDIEFEPVSDLLGAPAVMTRSFAAVGPGQTDLVLAYRRPWEDGEPAETFSVQVRGVGLFTGVEPSSPSTSGRGAEVEAENPARALAESVQAPQALPSSFNWCDQGGCTPVKNQGGCGSCWAFGTVGPLESQIKLQDGLTKDLSEQYLVSCNTDGWGCDGGWWAHDYHQWKVPSGEPDAGAVYEADFPYVASDVPCGSPHPHHEKIVSWHFVGSSSGVPSSTSIKQAIYDHGPLSVALCVNSAFQGYGGGVFSGPSCSSINHAVVLVGWDDSLGSGGAWRLRNSWGPGWGEGGYMWIEYGVSYVGYSANYIIYEGASPPAAPTGLEAKPASQTRIDLTWTDNSANETEFRIARSPNGASSWQTISAVGANETTYSDEGLAMDNSYFYQVWAHNEQGSSDVSNVDSARTYGAFTARAYVPWLTGGGGAGNGIENGDFEDGPAVWAESSSHGYALIINAGFPAGVAPHSGDWAVWLGRVNNETGTIQQQVTIPASHPYLHYYHWIDSAEWVCGYDFAYVRINGTAVETYDLCSASETGGWQEHVVDLGAYAGQTVSLELQVVTDLMLWSSLFVDDVSLQASAFAAPGGRVP